MTTKPRYSETLRKVAPIIAEMPRGILILRELALFERNSDSPEMSVACVLYWIGANYHDGQFSAWYRVLCVTGFEPGPIGHEPDPETEEGYLYETIVSILGT